MSLLLVWLQQTSTEQHIGSQTHQTSKVQERPDFNGFAEEDVINVHKPRQSLAIETTP